MQRGPVDAVRIVVLAYGYGLILGALSLAWHAAFRGGLPALAWWQWALAPLALGVVALTVEWLLSHIQNATGFGAAGERGLKRALHLGLLLLLLSAIILGPALYNIASP